MKPWFKSSPCLATYSSSHCHHTPGLDICPMQCILSTQSPAEERGGTGLAVGHLSATPCMQLFAAWFVGVAVPCL